MRRSRPTSKRNPDDGRGWEVIAPVYLRLGRVDDAVKARRNVLRLSGETAERRTALGETLVYAANGVVTAEAKATFERAVALDQGDVKARYFLGLAAEQDGSRAQAAIIWRELLAGAADDAPWAEFVRRALARVEGKAGPSDDDVAAASDLSPEQRGVMIRGMVGRLAERLHRDGSDVEGWLRLVRSYVVLGERDKARPPPPRRGARSRARPTRCAASTSWSKDWASKAEDQDGNKGAR